MMKEIHEQPKAVADTLNSVIREGKLDLTEIGLDDERIRSISQVYIVACGSAYHVGMAAQYVIEDLAGLPVRVELASEFRYRKPLLDPDGLAVIISQSGETADSLAALRECKEKGFARWLLSMWSALPLQERRIMYSTHLQDRRSRLLPPRRTVHS